MLIYLAHPYGGDAANLHKAKRWLQWCARVAQQIEDTTGDYVHVMAPWIPLCEVLPETDVDRRYGLRGAHALFHAMRGTSTAQAQQTFGVWAFGGISTGVRFEMSSCLSYGGDPWDMTALGDEPPTEIFDPREDPRASRWYDVRPEWWRVVEK